MVYDKTKSGDPDYDDKQPREAHGGKLVTAPDGREVLMTEAAGPVDAATGQHVNLDPAVEDGLDNRPAPGGVADAPSEVQTYSVEDTPVGDAKAEGAKTSAKTNQSPAADENRAMSARKSAK